MLTVVLKEGTTFTGQNNVLLIETSARVLPGATYTSQCIFFFENLDTHYNYECIKNGAF